MIRTGHSFDFEADWYIPEQKAAIQSLREWWEANKASFIKSPWTFANK